MTHPLLSQGCCAETCALLPDDLSRDACVHSCESGREGGGDAACFGQDKDCGVCCDGLETECERVECRNACEEESCFNECVETCENCGELDEREEDCDCGEEDDDEEEGEEENTLLTTIKQ